jgi:hypothetical protein
MKERATESNTGNCRQDAQGVATPKVVFLECFSRFGAVLVFFASWRLFRRGQFLPAGWSPSSQTPSNQRCRQNRQKNVCKYFAINNLHIKQLQVRSGSVKVGQTSADGKGKREAGFALAKARPLCSQSARGLAHSKTLRAIRKPVDSAPAFWSAVVFHRFASTAPKLSQTSENRAKFRAVTPGNAQSR